MINENTQKYISISIIGLLVVVSAIGLFDQFTNNIYKTTITELEFTEDIEPNLIHKTKSSPDFTKMVKSIQVYTKNLAAAEDYTYLIISAGVEYELNPWLIFSIAAKESSFRTHVSSSVGAIGLMQIMPFWKKEIGELTDDLTTPHVNIAYGCKVLKQYLKQYKTYNRALAAYNGSKGSNKYPDAVNSILFKHVGYSI